MFRTLLIDGNYQINRMLHVPELLELKAEDGRCTGGVFGILNTISKLLSEIDAWRCVVVFDGGHSQRRLSIYPRNPETGEGYKGNRLLLNVKVEEREARMKIREEVPKQIELATPILLNAGVHVFRWPDKEADDVIGRLARKLQERGPVVIASDDDDYLQLVTAPTTNPLTHGTKVYRPILDRWIAPENFVEVTGVQADWFLVKKAAEGDTSDNIDGIDGVGPKTMVAAIRGYVSTLSREAVTDQSWTEHRHWGYYPKDNDLSEFYSWCSKSTVARIKKIADGRTTIQRNLDLMDVFREPFDDNGMALLLQKLEIPRVLNERGVTEAMAALGMFSKVLAISEFLKPFRKLQ